MSFAGWGSHGWAHDWLLSWEYRIIQSGMGWWSVAQEEIRELRRELRS